MGSDALARVTHDGELLPPRDEGLTMITTPAEAKSRLVALQQFVQGVMRKDVDYGRIPGTNKDCLYKPGAEKLVEIYGLTPAYSFEAKLEDWDRMFFHYQIRCRLARGERTVAEGLGSCNSRESKYAWRWCWDNEIPDGVDKSVLKKMSGVGKGGKRWTKYRLPNEEIADVVNTILKMATKRAFVAAVISATRSSEIFTQDLEDMQIQGGLGDDYEERSTYDVLAEAIDKATIEDLRGPLKKRIAWAKEKKQVTDEQYQTLVKAGKYRSAALTKVAPAPDGNEPPADSGEQHHTREPGEDE